MGNSERIEWDKLEYKPLAKLTYNELETIIMKQQDAFESLIRLTWPITEWHVNNPSPNSGRSPGTPWTENDQFANMTSEQGEAINALRDYSIGFHRDGKPATREEVLGEFADILYSDVTMFQIFRVNENIGLEDYIRMVRKTVRQTVIKLWRRAKIVK